MRTCFFLVLLHWQVLVSSCQSQDELPLADRLNQETYSYGLAESPGEAEKDRTLIVNIPSLGKIQGRRSASVDFYGGIPYAAPPVGQLRFAPPEPPPPWTPAVLDGSHYGPDCWQLLDPTLNPAARREFMSEDCLTLNVVLPAGHAKRVAQTRTSSPDRLLPVLVWLHGGAFQQGGARRPEYDGHRLAQRDVIVVTFNYRLGALGFLVTSSDGVYGNFGLMDQRALLHFVHDNIIYFGGDPNRVTLFGESAGAVMTGQHLMMEGVGTLFQSAIMQSNPLGYLFRSVVIADFIGEALKRSVDCTDLECLRAERVEEIMRAQSSLMGIPRSVGDFFTWGPTLTQQQGRNLNVGVSAANPGLLLDYDDVHFQRRRRNRGKRARELYAVNVSQPLKNTHLIPDDIPLIIGSNKHEGEMFIHSAFPITMSKPVYWMFVGALFRDSASKILKHYRGYVEQIEVEANKLAKKQIEEEENKLYYLEHQEQLEKEYQILLDMSITKSNRILTRDYDRLQALVNTWSTGGGQQDPNADRLNATVAASAPSWYSNVMQYWVGQPEKEPMGNHSNSGEQTSKMQEFSTNMEKKVGPMQRVGSIADYARKRVPFLQPKDPIAEAERATEREMKQRARAKERALKEAAKVVVDYRPVMSRIINDYLFRCPSWHYAHVVSRNRVQNNEEDLNNENPAKAEDGRSTGRNAKQKQKRRRNNNNVYVYRFSQPTHIPGFKECWGKSCHTSELPYVFQAMSTIRSHYSTLSPFAQEEAPMEQRYPYTEMLAAYQGALDEMEEDQDEEDELFWKDTASPGQVSEYDGRGGEQTVIDQHQGPSSLVSKNLPLLNNYTSPRARSQLQLQRNFNVPESKTFQRLLKNMFGDYFVDDADEEIAADMAERWVSFAKQGDPNYDGSKAEWLPWRYVPTQVEDAQADDIPWQPQEFEYKDDDLDEEEDEDQATSVFQWSSDRSERIYRRRALKALGMEVIEEDIHSTELRRMPAASEFSEMEAVFTFLFGNAESNSRRKSQRKAGNVKMSKRAIRQVMQIAQAMGVVGTGLRGEPTRSSAQWDDDFFPEMIDLKWPPEGRLVERDCTCDMWDRIRYRY